MAVFHMTQRAGSVTIPGGSEFQVDSEGRLNPDPDGEQSKHLLSFKGLFSECDPSKAPPPVEPKANSKKKKK